MAPASNNNNTLIASHGTEKPKVLCLGVSYPSMTKTLERVGIDPCSDWYKDNQHEPNPEDTLGGCIHQVLECVQRDYLTAMDGRDLARCIATEYTCGVEVYTVSQENGAIYEEKRHMWANFNRSSFVKSLNKKFPNVVFDQVVLDYFWIPAGWDESHWSPSLFENTLVNFAKMNLLKRPPIQRNQQSALEGKTNKAVSAGSIILPFCFHCFKEVVASFSALKNFYNASFLRKGEFDAVSLWAGTQQIDSDSMQGILGKRLDQEDVYCSFGPCDVRGSLDDARVSKAQLYNLARQLEDFQDIRFIVLERLGADGKQGTFQGLVCPSKVRRGFEHCNATIPVSVTTPKNQRIHARTVTPSPSSAGRTHPVRQINSSCTRRKLKLDQPQTEQVDDGKRKSKRARTNNSSS